MCERYALQDWTTLAAGDSPRWQQKRLARHLSQCADCRAALASLQSVWNAVQPFAIEEINPTMKTQIQSAIALQSAPQFVRSRRAARRLPRRLALVGTLGLTAALALTAAPFLITRPLPAFADVERAMLAVKTARYHSVQSMDFSGLFKKASDTYVYENDNVLRFGPSASASQGIAYKITKTGKTKPTPTSSLENRFGSVVYFSDHEMYNINRNQADPGTAEEAKMETQASQSLLDRIGPPTARKTRDAPPEDANNKTGAWKASRVSVARQPLIKFERQRDIASPGNWREKIYETVWTDPQTNLVVRTEQHDIDLDSKKESASYICDNYRYNENIPETEFQAPMPPQAHLMVMNNQKDKKPPEVSAADRAAIQKLISASDLAWSQGDFAQFAAVWDFDYMALTYLNPAEAAQFPAQRSQYYKELTLAQRGVWKSWHTGINKITPVSIGSGIPDAFRVETFSNLRWRDRPAMRENEYTYYVRNTPNGWRVLDWNPEPGSLTYPGDKKN